jgi:hypothetical protein
MSGVKCYYCDDPNVVGERVPGMPLCRYHANDQRILTDTDGRPIDDQYRQLREQAAINLITFANMVRFDNNPESVRLQAKYVVDDIVKCASQAHADCLNKGIQR